MITISVLQLPGRGLQDVSVPAGSTVADLLRGQYAQLFSGRGIIVDGRDILPNEYSRTVLSAGQEVAAVTAVKGN